MPWTQKAVEILIEEYRARPILYNTKDPLYHNRVKKELAYQGIVDALSGYYADCTIDVVKKKINGLRSHFSREVDKMKTNNKSGSGTSDLYTPSVWWFQKMQFIKDHLDPRVSTSSMTLLGGEEDEETTFKVIQW